MISVNVDVHTHTLFSGHAFSTIEENAIHAKEKGLEAIAMTDHFGFCFAHETVKDAKLLNAGPSMNMGALPKVIHGVRILAGTEIDIVDFDGNLAGHDVPSWNPDKSYADAMLDSRDIAIASVHSFPGHDSGTIAQNTKMYCNVAANPKIDIIGHPIRSGIKFETRELLKIAKEFGCMIEVNEHSFDFGDDVVREYRNLLVACAEMGIHVVVGSDAHSSFFVGEFGKALSLLDEIGFPEELVANVNLDRLKEKGVL